MTFQIPLRMQSLPTYRRRPIPYTVATTPDGHPDFSVLASSTRIREVAQHQLCGTCREPLTYWIFFLGAAASARHREYVDPPGHEECIRSAFALCPYIAHRDIGRRPTPDPKALMPLGMTGGDKAPWVLYKTRSYRYRVAPDAITFHPAPAVATETYGYRDDGTLTRVS